MNKKTLKLISFLFSIIFIFTIFLKSDKLGLRPTFNEEITISLKPHNLQNKYGYKISDIRIGEESIPVEKLEINKWKTTNNSYPIYIDDYVKDNYIKIKPSLKLLNNSLFIEREIASKYWFADVKFKNDKYLKLSANNANENIAAEEITYQKGIWIVVEYALVILAITGMTFFVYNILLHLLVLKDVNVKFFIKNILKFIPLFLAFFIAYKIKGILEPASRLGLFGRQMGRYEFFVVIFLSWVSGFGLRYFLKKHDKLNNYALWLLFFVNPLVSFAICELSYNGLFSSLTVNTIVINYIILMLLQTFIMVLTRSRKISCVVIVTISLIFGVLNDILIILRTTPVLPSYLMMITAGLNVAGETDITFRSQSIATIIYTISYLLVIIAPGRVKHDKITLKKYFLPIISYCLILAVLMSVSNKFYFKNDKKVHLNWWRPQETYYTQGSTKGFYTIFVNSSLKKPKDYNEKEVKALLDEYDRKKMGLSRAKTDKKPNIVFILSETLNDYQGFGDGLFFTEDPLAYTKSVDENMIKGKLNMSVIGGGTINTEYEVVTGNPLSFFPPGTSPSQQFIKKGSNSIVNLLKNQGYNTYATHPQPGTNYGRYRSWEYLGFEGRDFLEKYRVNGKIPEEDLVRHFVADKAVYRKIVENIKNSDKPLLAFGATMQNHGGYRGDFKGDIQIAKTKKSQISPEEHTVMEEFVNLVKVTDKANEEFFEQLKEIDEPTIVCIFGDHQPGKAEYFINNGYGQFTDQNSHWTPYFVWANYDISTEENPQLGASFLSSFVIGKSSTDVGLSAYQKYELDFMKEYPSLTTLFNLDKDLNEVSDDPKFKKKKEELDKIVYFNITNPKEAAKYFSKPASVQD